MLQVGEDRLAERVEEALESGGADVVLSEFIADQSALSTNETTLKIRIEQTCRSEAADLVVSSS